VSTRALRPLLASRGVRLRARLGAVGDWLSRGGAPGVNPLGALGDPGPEGPDELEALDLGGSGALRRLLLRPGVLLFLGLAVVALVAERSVLAVRGGLLSGGALLPPAGGAGDLWSAYLSSWHDVSVGTSMAAPPSTATLALLSTLCFGKPWLAVDVLLLASVPLAGVTAYLASGRLVRHLYLRLWVAATWALLPVATGTIAVGRLDTAVVQVILPLLVLAAGRVLTASAPHDGWWRAWALGLGLGLTCTLAPLLWPLAAVVLLAGAAVNLARGARRGALEAVLVAVVPAAVLFPWSLELLRHPSLLVAGSQLGAADLPTWHLLLLSPGGPAVPAAWVTVGVLLAGLAGTVRADYRRLALVCWAVALLGLSAALLLAHLRVDGRLVWPGPALQLTGLAVLVAGLVAASGARSRLARSSFGWRQLVSGLVAVTAGLAPMLLAGAWVVRGADDPLHRDDRALLPAFALAELQANPGLRSLVLAPAAGGSVGYLLSDGEGARLEEAGLRSSSAQRRALDAIVADLASPRGSDAAEALATRAVRYVAVRTVPGSEPIVAGLDAQVGLVRRTSGAVVLWQVVAPAARLSVLPPVLADRARAGDGAPTLDQLRTSRPVALTAGAEGARATVPSGPEGRLLVLADAADSGWHATLDGKALPSRTAWGWAQGFVLPASGGRLELWHTHATRQAALGLQAVVLVLLLVLSAPGRRRRRGLEEDGAGEEPVMSRQPGRALVEVGA
ncbi:MAG: hypothetical protein WCD35_11530, partial [Mycobacteriales bacterium]